MEFRLLGPVECVVAGERIALGRPQQRCLLAILLVEMGRVVPVDRLVELLWDGEPPRRARSIVHTHVSRLRARLRAAGVERHGIAVETRGAGYLITGPPEAVDLHRFRALLDQARESTDPARRARLLRTALELWHGPPLSDVATGRVVDQICAGLTEQRLAALEDRVEAELALGQHRQLVTELTDLAARYPLRERLVGLLMLALYRSGQQARALAAYRETRRMLVDTLGIEPGAPLRRLEQAILAQDPALDLAVAGPAEPAARGRAATWHGRRSHLTSIVGRDRELAELTALLTDHRLVTVVGPAGVGKTTLALHAAELLAADTSADAVAATPTTDATSPPARTPCDASPAPRTPRATSSAPRAPDHALVASPAPGIPHGALPDSRIPHDVVVVPLAAARSHDDVVVALADLLSVKGASVAELLTGVERYVADRPVLVVLDNCEHLREPCVALVRRLLAADRRLVVLATSRQPLGLPEETVWRLSPMAVPPEDGPVTPTVPAMALLLRRAREALPGFTPTDADLAALARICRRVDGLPLALELAASRLRILPPATLAAHLEHDFGLLADALTATLDWSYRLLTADERRLLARLSVFRDGFTAEAAEQVCGIAPLAPEQVLPMLVTLVDRSLVQPDEPSGTRRFRLLEVVRAHAATCLAEFDETEAMADRHLTYWLDRVRAIHNRPLADDQIAGFTGLRPERDNLRAAGDHAFAAGRTTAAVELTALVLDFWAVNDGPAEVERWLDRVEPYLADAPGHLRSHLRFSRALTYTNRNDYAGALRLIRSALAELRTHYPILHAEALISATRAQTRLLDPAAPAAAADLFAARFETPDRHLLLHAVAMQAEALIVWGRYAEAADLLTDHREQYQNASPSDTTRCCYLEVLAYLGQGRFDDAEAAGTMLVTQADRPGNYLHYGRVAEARGLRALLTRSPAEAATVITGLIDELTRRYPPSMSRAYVQRILLAEAERRAGRPTRALGHLTEGLRYGVTCSDYTTTLPAVLVAGLLADDLGDAAAGRDLVGRWDRTRRGIGLPAPLGLAEPVAALGLDPAPAVPDPTYRWSLDELAALVRYAYSWCSEGVERAAAPSLAG